MKTSENLTSVYDDRMQTLIANTPEGMAHWAGTGPEGKTCRECRAYNSPGYYAGTNPTRAHLMMPGKCATFRRMTGKSGQSFRPGTACCRFFDEDPDPKPLREKLMK